MKTTRTRLAEIIKEEYQSLTECWDCRDTEQNGDVEDYEADMFKGHLYTMAKQAHQLNEIISEHEDIEEWVQEKVAVASNMLDTVYDYMMYQKSKDEERNEIVVDAPTDEYEYEYVYEDKGSKKISKVLKEGEDDMTPDEAIEKYKKYPFIWNTASGEFYEWARGKGDPELKEQYYDSWEPEDFQRVIIAMDGSYEP